MSRPAYFAIAARGTESVLADEFNALGIAPVAIERGGVRFGTNLEDGYRACLWSRIASRILHPLATFDAPDAGTLYDGIRDISWADHLEPRRTLAVDVAGKDAPAGPGHFLALKAKDAIVDRIRESCGQRPNVDTKTPNLRINLHVAGPRVTVSLDLSGRGLHRRGRERSGADAPLKENLAAAILRLACWPDAAPDIPLFDPLCGSGTLLLEAAAMRLDRAPGLGRPLPGGGGWKGHNATLWQRLQDEAEERRHASESQPVRLAGADAAAKAVAAARRTLQAARLTGKITIVQGELRDAQPPWSTPGLVVTNPPYGVRLGEEGELGPFYGLLGDVLKRRFAGWTAWVFTGNIRLGKQIGLRPASRHVLFNGPIESRLLELPIATQPVAGTAGPGWRRASPEAKALTTRLTKNLAQIRPWAKRFGTSCYRIYDADVPVYNLAIDWYEGAVRIEEYARPRKVRVADAERRLRDALHVVPDLLGVTAEQVTLRVRQRRGANQRHDRRENAGRTRVVREGGLRFEVNLEDYLDTGLFLDDRLLRHRIQQRAHRRQFLNLFAYTCTASVAAAAGGALATTSIDLSKRHLEWGRRNFRLNGIDPKAHQLVRAEASQWLSCSRDRYDLVLVSPPTHSGSRAMQTGFDIQRDHVTLFERVCDRLAPGGELIFAPNLRSFELDTVVGTRCSIEEITSEVTPLDFERRPRLRAWSLKLRGGRPLQ